MVFSSEIALAVSWRHTEIDVALREVLDANAITQIETLLETVADAVYYERRTLTDTSTQDYDLSDGTLLDAMGNTIAFQSVMGLVVSNTNDVTGDTLVVGGGSNPVTTWVGAAGDTMTVGPAGVLALWTRHGYIITASTADNLRIQAVGGDVTYDVAIIGLQV